MKWWQDERKAALRPEQRWFGILWACVAAVGWVLLLIGLWQEFAP